MADTQSKNPSAYQTMSHLSSARDENQAESAATYSVPDSRDFMERPSSAAKMQATHTVLAHAGASFATELSDLLVSTYGSIDQIESRMLHTGHGLDISVNEGRLLDIVGRTTLHGAGELTVSQIAEAAGVRRPSATAAINRMVDKGFLAKKRNSHDARCINVTLTRSGERVYRLHVIFHARMAEAVAGDMTPQERSVLLAGIRRLERFYAQTGEA